MNENYKHVVEDIPEYPAPDWKPSDEGSFKRKETLHLARYKQSIEDGSIEGVLEESVAPKVTKGKPITRLLKISLMKNHFFRIRWKCRNYGAMTLNLKI